MSAIHALGDERRQRDHAAADQRRDRDDRKQLGDVPAHMRVHLVALASAVRTARATSPSPISREIGPCSDPHMAPSSATPSPAETRRAQAPRASRRASLFDRLHSGRFDREVILDGFDLLELNGRVKGGARPSKSRKAEHSCVPSPTDAPRNSRNSPKADDHQRRNVPLPDIRRQMKARLN